MAEDKIREVISAIVSIRDHDEDCGCSSCEKDKQTISENPEVVTVLTKLI